MTTWTGTPDGSLRPFLPRGVDAALAFLLAGTLLAGAGAFASLPINAQGYGRRSGQYISDQVIQFCARDLNLLAAFDFLQHAAGID